MHEDDSHMPRRHTEIGGQRMRYNDATKSRF